MRKCPATLLSAITKWGIPDSSKLNRLAGITQPTIVANGDNDTILHTENSHFLAEYLGAAGPGPWPALQRTSVDS